MRHLQGPHLYHLFPINPASSPRVYTSLSKSRQSSRNGFPPSLPPCRRADFEGTWSLCHLHSQCLSCRPAPSKDWSCAGTVIHVVGNPMIGFHHQFKRNFNTYGWKTLVTACCSDMSSTLFTSTQARPNIPRTLLLWGLSMQRRFRCLLPGRATSELPLTVYVLSFR
jgi:hypothetical protein